MFPPAESGEASLVAVGGDLSPERLLTAYRGGIFPWYEEGMPILWHSPDPRCVLELENLHVGRTVRKAQKHYEVTMDKDFNAVILACQEIERPGQTGTWITGDMREAYCTLSEMGYAHSVEVWKEGTLVGGLYGVSLGLVFFGESMFSYAPNASKVALLSLADRLRSWGFAFIDAQVMTSTTEQLGAVHWPRTRFLSALGVALSHPTRIGKWNQTES